MHAKVYLSDRLDRGAFDLVEDYERVPVAADERSLHNWVATPNGHNPAKRESRPVSNWVIIFVVALPHAHQIGTSKNASACPLKCFEGTRAFMVLPSGWSEFVPGLPD